MKKMDNPKTIFEHISAIKNHFNTAVRQMDNDNLIAIVLDPAPQTYTSVLTAVQMQHGEKLTLLHLKTAICTNYYGTVSTLQTVAYC
jgi:hypothetical protein